MNHDIESVLAWIKAKCPKMQKCPACDGEWRMGEFIQDADIGFFEKHKDESISIFVRDKKKENQKDIRLIPLVCCRCFYSVLFSSEIFNVPQN